MDEIDGRGVGHGGPVCALWPRTFRYIYLYSEKWQFEGLGVGPTEYLGGRDLVGC